MAPENWTQDQNTKTKIFIVEDHPIFRMGMKDLINQEKDLTVCGEADDLVAARKAITKFKPDMLIIDISLKNGNGLELVKEISKTDRAIPSLVLSMHDEALWAERSLKAGAKGYIMKQEASESVVLAIRQILKGKIYLSERIMLNILDRFYSRPDPKPTALVHHLTNREMEVFQLIGDGLSTGKVAEKLNLSAKTIGTYRERIKEKLGMKSSAQLIRYAVLWVEEEKSRGNPPLA